jgi:MoaA/NifB/PqqE/SkfB family radical SAM enzyme
MKRVDVKVGFRCNNFCKFCVQGDKRVGLPSKELSVIVQALQDGARTGAKGLVLTGGEPTLHRDLLEIVRRAKALGYQAIQIQSNGRLFCYDKLCRSLIAAGATEFSPALHGSRAEIHDFLTGAPGSFLETVAGIRNLKKLGPRIMTNTVITKPNYRDLPAIARLLVALGVDQYQFAYMHLTGRAGEHKTWLAARKHLIEPYVKKGLDVGIRGHPLLLHGGL